MNESEPVNDRSFISARSPIAVFAMLPERGAFNASFVLAKELNKRGWRAVYIGPAAFRDHVRAQGLEYHAISLPEEAGPAARSPTILGGFRTWRHRVAKGHRNFRTIAETAEAALRTINPTLALLDPLMWRFSVPFLKLKIPIVGLNTTLASTFSLEYPPVFSYLTPGERPSWKGRWQNLSAWSPLLVKEFGNLVREDVGRVIALGPRQARSCRPRSLIKQFGGHLALGEYGPRLRVPELVLAPRALEFPGILAKTRRIYLGTSVDLDRVDDQSDLLSFIPENKPLIYCSLGTYSRAYHHAKKLFLAVFAAARDLRDFHFLLQLGDAVDVGEFAPGLENVTLLKTAPQVQVLERTAIFITHGGFSSVREAALLGVPMIVFPCWLDQPGNATRAVYHGLGLIGDISNVTPAVVRSLVQKVQAPCFTSALGNLKSSFDQEIDYKISIYWIESLIERASHDPFILSSSHGEAEKLRGEYQ